MPAEVESVEHLGPPGVRVLLASGALAPGDAVHVAWDGLADFKGRASADGARLEAR